MDLKTTSDTEVYFIDVHTEIRAGYDYETVVILPSLFHVNLNISLLKQTSASRETRSTLDENDAEGDNCREGEVGEPVFRPPNCISRCVTVKRERGKCYYNLILKLYYIVCKKT
jgi:hypothetical protein